METAPRDLVIERFRAVAEQEREEEVANHKHAPVLNDMTLDGFVVVPPVSKSSANTDKCDWLREHLDEDRDVQSFISSESGDSVEQFKKANTSLTFGDIVAEIQFCKMVPRHRLVLFEETVPEDIQSALRACCHKFYRKSFAVDLAQCEARDMRNILVDTFAGLAFCVDPPANNSSSFSSLTQATSSAGQSTAATPKPAAETANQREAGAGIGAKTTSGSLRPEEVAGAGMSVVSSPGGFSVFGGLPLPYRSPREQAGGHQVARILEMSSSIQQVTQYISIRISNCRAINEWSKGLAEVLSKFAKTCSSSAAMPSLENFAAIVELWLDGNQISSSSFARFAPTLELMPSLVLLDLSNNRLGSEDLHLLGPMMNSGPLSLQRLAMWGNHLGFDGAAVLAQYLQENRSLFAVDIGSNNIGDQGFRRILSAIVKNPKSRIRWLGCDNDGLTSDSVLALAGALSDATRTDPIRGAVVSMLGNQFHDMDLIRSIMLPLPQRASQAQDSPASIEIETPAKKVGQQQAWPLRDHLLL